MENTNLKFNIITPSKVVYSDYVKYVYFADDQGDIVILNNYEPTIGKVKRSVIKVVDFQDNIFEFIVDNGVYSVANCELNFLTSFCINDTDEERKKISVLRQKTLEILNKKNLNDFNLNYEILILKQIAELKNKN